ncbi:hypothetical protein [Nocardioides sp. 616]|uniref:hypothetical protein n=1 Tax=Nocardioides sp. 616 TaxID=2268090 RepID=UPI000CE51E28|nr:hypothetical protein [Nocardioides sp. 616]
MTIRLSEETEAQLARLHDEAAKGITGLAGGVPTSVDAGEGTSDVLAIIAAVVGTADDIALVNEAAAAQVRAVGEGLGSTDGAVASGFDSMEVVVE